MEAGLETKTPWPDTAQGVYGNKLTDGADAPEWSARTDFTSGGILLGIVVRLRHRLCSSSGSELPP